MRILNQNGFSQRRREGPPPVPGRPVPPHERKGVLRVELERGDWELLLQVFRDEDTAGAAADIICGAPPEIQILAVQLIDLMKEDI